MARTALLRAFLFDSLMAERERWILWLAPLLALGIAIYFLLPLEPPLWMTVPGWGVLAAAALHWRRERGRQLALLILATALLGFQVAQLRSHSVAAPVLTREIGPLTVEGRVVAAEPLLRGYRFLLDKAVLEDVTPDATPAYLRISASSADEPMAPGSRLRFLARLRPPPAPSAPGDYDFARAAWFQQLGGVGFAFGAPDVLDIAPRSHGPAAQWQRFWSGLRQTVTERVLAVLPQPSAGVAVALLTGQRGAIQPQALDAFRDSGLAHLLAISGLHIGLVAGSLFLVVRAGLALWPALALRHPIKRYAAVVALLGAGVYLLLAGAPVPTQRAFLMTALVLLGVLTDRTAISLRLVAWAAIAVLLVSPESLLSASFQLSFAAVVALVAGYEALRSRRERRWRDGGVRQYPRPLVYLAGLLLTSLIAGVATAPFTLHHFETVPLYGLLANLFAVPLTAMLVMPLAIASLLAMPVGWEAPPLWLMGQGIEAVLRVADSVAALEGAVLRLPAMAPWGFVACVLGGLWLCLWRRPWRFAGVLPLLLGLASSAWTAPPDLVLSGDGRLLAVQARDGALLFNSRRVNRFSAEQWLGRAGLAVGERLPRAGDGGRPEIACDDLACVLTRGGLEVVVVFEGEALEEDCRRADLLLAVIPVPAGCAEGADRPREVIDRHDLRRHGGLALWLDSEGRYRLRRVADQRGDRPWSWIHGE